MTQGHDTADLVGEAFETVFSGHRIDQIDRFFAEDFVQHSPYVPPGGRAELAEWLSGTLQAIPDLTYTLDEVIGCGDAVVIFTTVSGTIRGDMPAYGITGSGQSVSFRTAHLLRVRDDKITWHWEVVDSGPLVQLARGG